MVRGMVCDGLGVCTTTDCGALPPTPLLTNLTPKSLALIPAWRGSGGNIKLFPGQEASSLSLPLTALQREEHWQKGWTDHYKRWLE